jgi:hypothetical protein
MAKEESNDIEKKLKELVDGKGQLMIYYGGYEIVVNDKESFKWSELFDYVLHYNFNVYVGLKDGKLNVIIKQNW